LGRAARTIARAALTAGAAAALVGLAIAPGTRDARADDASSGGVTGAQCTLKGTAPVAKGVQIFDAASGGKAIANFTGAFSPLAMSDIPADPTAGRAKFSTSTGSGGFRIDGFVAPTKVDLYTTHDIAVSGSHVWISSAHKVRMTHAAANSLTVELTIAGSQSQTVKATAPCDSFALQRGTPTAMDVPGQGRGYLMKNSTLDLFEEPNGNVVLHLNMVEGAGHLFWSTESRAGFVHVQMRSDLTIDAWARLRDLDPLKKGEMMDQLIPPSTAVTGAQLALDKPPPLARATRDIALRAGREDKEKPIGAIESGAEVYVMETVAKWTNVLPRGLGVMPPDGQGFWIPSSEVPAP
jgi:hypothetical protein